ncbi:Actin- protein 8 [Clonorchis sinensis]|uniref:Actin- protein 8 n=1 Tax=Clonorchis sinensis TaxID=79923 RepID=A0A419Q8T1_CLOSI|nr:Actin- protein 8 [Clonorchis sinensis]
MEISRHRRRWCVWSVVVSLVRRWSVILRFMLLQRNWKLSSYGLKPVTLTQERHRLPDWSISSCVITDWSYETVMPCPLNTAENTIIVEPGSYYLKIGRLCGPPPKKLHHCIARRLSVKRKTENAPLITGRKVTFGEEVTKTSLWSDIRGLFSVALDNGASVDETDIHSISVEHSGQSKFMGNTDDAGEFVVFDDALLLASNPHYRMTWPIANGFFRDGANYSSVLQDLEDIWCVALEKQLGINRSDFSSYRVILVIGDVFRRHEVRYLADVLLQRLGFSHLFVHQSAVCATYGLGVTTACVVDIGELKTSVCCVDNGISPPDTRVVLSVGRNNVLRTFHGVSLPNGITKGNEDYVDFDYTLASDVNALRTWLTDAERSAHSLIFQLGQLEKQDAQLMEPTTDQRFELTLGNAELHFTVPLRVGAVIYANLLPFRQISLTADPIRLDRPSIYHECQMSPLDASQPDDPFDDLYINMTTRERRKRGGGQGAISADTVATDATGDVRMDRSEPDVAEVQPTPMNDTQISPQARSTAFESLPNAIWWSIYQCAFTVSAQSTSETGTLAYPMAPVSQASAEELRRRLLRCVVLIGGGSCGPSGRWLAKWLTSELSSLLASTFSINAPMEDGNRPPVEVVTFDDQSDLAWCGARLLLTADSSSDMWITQSEWKKYGSRTLREKAPFLW